MAEEESAFDLYANVEADIKQFEKDLEKAEMDLEKLKEKEITVQVQTEQVEAGFAAVSLEGTLFASVLGTIWDNVKKNSGGVQALTSLAWGYMGAGLDTFISKVLLPAWDALTGTEEEEIKVLEEVGTTAEGTAEKLKAMYDDDGKLVQYFEDNEGAANDLFTAIREGDVVVDEYGNTLIKVGDDILVFDQVTMQYIGTLSGWSPLMRDINSDNEVLKDKVMEAAQAYGEAWEDVWWIIERGWAANQEMLAKDNVPDWYLEAAEAADEVWRQLSANMVRLGVDPTTGDPISDATYKNIRAYTLGGENVQGPLSVDSIVNYFLNGGI